VLPAGPGRTGALNGVLAPASSSLPLPRDGSGTDDGTVSTPTASTDTGRLAYTGSPVRSLLLAGLLALALGLGLTVSARRRVG
jgi:hypothetical protein